MSQGEVSSFEDDEWIPDPSLSIKIDNPNFSENSLDFFDDDKETEVRHNSINANSKTDTRDLSKSTSFLFPSNKTTSKPIIGLVSKMVDVSNDWENDFDFGNGTPDLQVKRSETISNNFKDDDFNEQPSDFEVDTNPFDGLKKFSSIINPFTKNDSSKIPTIDSLQNLLDILPDGRKLLPTTEDPNSPFFSQKELENEIEQIQNKINQEKSFKCLYYQKQKNFKQSRSQFSEIITEISQYRKKLENKIREIQRSKGKSPKNSRNLLENCSKLEIESEIQFAKLFQKKQKNEKAKKTLFQALELSKQQRNLKMESCVELEIAVLFSKTNNSHDALNMAELSLKHLTKSRFDKLEQFKRKTKKSKRRMSFETSSFSFFFTAEDYLLLSRACYLIGDIYFVLSNSFVSKELSKKFIELAIKYLSCCENEKRKEKYEQKIKEINTEIEKINEQNKLSLDLKQDSESFSDWDKEIDEDEDSTKITPKASRPNFGSLLRKVLLEEKQTNKFLPKWKIRQSINTFYCLVKYPPPSILYSSWGKTKNRVFTERTLENWLSNLIIKYLNNWSETLNQACEDNFINESLPHVEQFSLKWFQIFLEAITANYYKEKKEKVQEIATNFFTQFETLTTQKISAQEDDDQNIFNIVLSILRILGINSKEAKFKEYLKKVSDKYTSQNHLHFDLLLIEYYSHQDDISFEYQVNVIEEFRRIYYEAKELEKKNIKRKNGVTESEFLKGSALVDLCLYFNFISPLTGENWAFTNTDFTNDIDFRAITSNFRDEIIVNEEKRVEEMVSIYNNLNLENYYDSLLKSKIAYSVGIHYLNTAKYPIAEQFLCESLFILDRKSSETKLEEEEEQKDKTEKKDGKLFKSNLLIPLLTRYGTNVMLGYGDILIINMKYKYAILSLQNAMRIFKVIGTKEIGIFTKRMATICYENNDLKNSLKYYFQILETMKKQNRINEVIFVSEVISSLLLSLGDFEEAAKVLNQACGIINPIIKTDEKNQKLNTQFIEIQITLAKIYLKSSHVEKAISLLSSLPKNALPRGIKSQVLFLLAKAYLKNGWCFEGLDTLDQYEREEALTIVSQDYLKKMPFTDSYEIQGVKPQSEVKIKPNFDQFGKRPIHKRTLSSSNLSIPVQFFREQKEAHEKNNLDGDPKTQNSKPVPRRLHSQQYRLNSRIGMQTGKYQNEHLKERPKFLELLSSMNLKMHNLRNAFYWANLGIYLISAENIGMLARFYYLKGKILRELSMQSNHEEFPIKMNVSQELFEKKKFGAPLPMFIGEERVFENTGQIVQECQQAFQNALGCFQKTANVFFISKTQSKIAEILLDYVFANVALLRKKFEDVGKIPTSQTKAKKGENEKKENMKKNNSNNEPDKEVNFAEPNEVSDPTKTIEVSDSPHNSTSSLFSLFSDVLTEKLISLSQIEELSAASLETASSLYVPFQVCVGYLNFAELRILQKDHLQAKEFFTECRDLFFQLFMNGNTCLLAQNTPLSTLNKVYRVLRRLTRILFSLDNETLNDNLFVIDAFIMFQYEFSLSQKSTVNVYRQMINYINFQVLLQTPSLTEKQTRKLKKELLQKYSDCSETRVVIEMLDKKRDPKHLFIPFPERTDQKGVSEKIWSLLYGLKTNQRKKLATYISNDEYLERAKSLLNQICKIAEFARVSQPKMKQIAKNNANNLTDDMDQDSHLHISYSSLLKCSPHTESLVYLLLIDDILICYVPFLRRKVISCLGGRRFPKILTDSKHHQNTVNLALLNSDSSSKNNSINYAFMEKFMPQKSPKNSHPKLFGQGSIFDEKFENYDDDFSWHSPNTISPSQSNFSETTDSSIGSPAPLFSTLLRDSQIKFFSVLLSKNQENSESKTDSYDFHSFVEEFPSISEVFSQISPVQTDNPKIPHLMLICSKWLSAFPWENIYSIPIVRSFSLHHLINSITTNLAQNTLLSNNAIQSTPDKTSLKEKHKFPHYYLVVSSKKTTKKHSVDKKKSTDKILSEFLYQINHSNKPEAKRKPHKIFGGSQITKSLPKSKYFSIVHLQSLELNKESFEEQVHKNLKEDQFPVLIITFRQLLDFPPLLYSLFTSSYAYSLLVVPKNQCVHILKFLCKKQDRYIKSLSSKKKVQKVNIFLDSANELRHSENIPIIIISSNL
ncbi:hypothetical protein M0811_03124 [Anaeramoeba ignava]|uniref:Uncharacterized protein n=1 Tax=Anaeramoeba ignava TaxID=1746090 RepID=A0A9Q0L7F2_ANAIG|nr:hypothetical protein M0811_03124 [Anaeramoeba ignava]